MTCQHCQTWILDVEHRCRRCGRRARSTPPRISPATYPIAAAATAPAYNFSVQEDVMPQASPQAKVLVYEDRVQQPLFSQPASVPNVIPFDQFASPEEKESIRARGASLLRPTPVKNEKVEAPHARPQRRMAAQSDQRRFEFQGEEQVLSQPGPSLICDAAVAPPSMRFRSAVVDGSLVLLGCAICVSMYFYVGGPISFDKHDLPYFLLSLITVPLLYKLVWAFAGRDTPGMQKVGLQLVDFDGNPPSKGRRYLRLLSELVSFLAAGMGLIWAFVDEDTLTWHDHMSNTFPAIVSGK